MLQLIPYGEVIAEHNAYLPLVGFSLLVGDVYAALQKHRRGLATSFAIVLLAGLAIRSAVRVPDWANEISLWRSTLAVADRGVRSRHNLAVALAGKGELLAAQREFRIARELAPDDLEILLGMGSIEEQLGYHARAEALALQVLASRRDPQAEILLGWAQMGQGKLVQAERTFRRVLQRLPTSADAQRGLAQIREQSVS